MFLYNLVSKIVHLYKLIRLLIKSLIELNIFNKYSQDEHAQKNGRLSTKLYFLILILCLFIFGIYLSLEKQTHRKLVLNPTKIQYETLQNESFDEFQCPCNHISIKYGDFLQFHPTYHELCSSIFASNLWYNAYVIWNITNSCYYPSFQNLASFYFSLLLTFCQSANETISNSLTQFYALEYITSNVIQEIQFNYEIMSLIESFQVQLQNLFRQQWNLLQSVLANNQIISVRKTNFILNGKMMNQTVVPYSYIKQYENCTCGTNSLCYETLGFCIPSRRDYIKGMRVGCYMVESLFLSTTECFYDEHCLDIIKSYMRISAPIYSKLNILNKTLPSQYKTNDSIEKILKNLFIEQWNEFYSYEMYFNQCQPSVCSYFISQSPSFISTFTKLIGIYGGLNILLKFFLPNLVYFIRRKKRQQTGISFLLCFHHDNQ
ncbi:unnamed protein product [Adineta ricciae]|uniref:Transmembrane protein n=1 Tax=Adineta ricciae TaxID=249248 RepID=A0A814J036_ADIRI|nr:unnamed protein product [Adineta ricciae]CAF1345108.1 unnamed protein product [Adineta ricciae]